MSDSEESVIMDHEAEQAVNLDPAMDVEAMAEAAINQIMPQASKGAYEKSYKRFKNWCAPRNAEINEKSLLAYFHTELKQYAASTKWSHFSMLKACINRDYNIDMKSYTSLLAYLKRVAEGFVAKKSDILSKAQIIEFLRTTDDENYLLLKVILIIGVFGGLRRKELTYLKTTDVRDLGDSLGAALRQIWTCCKLLKNTWI